MKLYIVNEMNHIDVIMQIIFDPHRHRPHFLIAWKDEKKNQEYVDVMAIKPADQQAYASHYCHLLLFIYLHRLIACAFELTRVLELQDLAILSLHQVISQQSPYMFNNLNPGQLCQSNPVFLCSFAC